MRMHDVNRLLVYTICIYSTLAYELRRSNHERDETSASFASENGIYYEPTKLRHRSRFPSLDRLATKIDGWRPQGGARGRATVRPTRATTTTTTQKPAAYDEGDDYEDWYDEEDDKEAKTDDYGEEIPSDDLFSDEDDFQAEEATEPPVQERPKSALSAISQYKWENYGTRAKVEENRVKYLESSTRPPIVQREALVQQHFQKLHSEGLCKRPQKKVLPVQDIHPEASLTYYPHCTILHRCAEDTGCCPKVGTKCGPKSHSFVHLPFYIKRLGTNEMKIITLEFINHTECACVEKATIPITENLIKGNTHLAVKSGYSPHNQIRHSNCKCPAELTPIHRSSAKCECDCNRDECGGMKKGNEHFGIMDRKCIDDNRCGVPVCEYGIYLSSEGRCQQKHEKLQNSL